MAGHGRGCLLGRVFRVPVGSGAVVVAVVIAATNAADAVGHLRDLLVELGAPQDGVHRRQPDQIQEVHQHGALHKERGKLEWDLITCQQF